ncbi:MAG: hypothetical protein CR982_00790 [Candidatus Cloacimonadota bacterium]|nr:MAG: hypothetical protein CR982_00790 [Candidatus Cloacimonadota bacterium]PIE78392.1 MAG: hypothetical protein CSA15_07940 [Candidatus Delongbacteria bacterium]
MGKATHISENISKTQIVEMIFDSIKKSSKNQSEAIAEETLKKFTKDSEKVSKSKESEKIKSSKKNEVEEEDNDSLDNEDNEDKKRGKKRDRYKKFKTKGKNIDIKG